MKPSYNVIQPERALRAVRTRANGLAGKTLAAAISDFGAALKAKLSAVAVSGAPEDQLRGPLENLIRDLAEASGLPAGAVGMVGETSLADLKTRPDYAVSVQNALVGFIEVKAPGKGADPRKFKDGHDKDQWTKLKSLPNLLYTDGNAFSLWRDGKLVDRVALSGDVESAGAKLAAPPALLPLISDFLRWAPIPPKSAKQLAEVAARLCRLLRDQVIEELARGNKELQGLARDWRKLLFPEANDQTFADGYAQAVTFGLLVARARNITLSNGIDDAAQELRKTNSLIGTALRLLTDEPENQKALATSLGTLTRVLDAVNWSTISKDSPDAWLYFYEDFLEVYDNTLRKRTGSYYTPPEVVAAMVNLVDEALRSPLFERPAGLASSDVTLADPAVGTGTFLLGVLRKIAEIVRDDQGPGAIRGAIEAAAKRVFGFELQFGPYAVAQLRLIAEMQALMTSGNQAPPKIPELSLFITDTLGNPFVEQEDLGTLYAPIAKSRRDANTVKKQQKITVVLGNPPYKEKAEGRGSWVEAGTPSVASLMERWRPPAEWKVGAHAKHLKNLYVFFWRWATWKALGCGVEGSTQVPNRDEEGIVCFITVAGFLNGPGFQRMRDDLRRTCSDIWVIDCSPEGHQPEVATRIFQGVQQPICIVLAARRKGEAADKAATVRVRQLPAGRREDKFAALKTITLQGSGWVGAPTGWREPFLPEAEGGWATYPKLGDLFVYNGSGVMPGRTWVIAPDRQSLSRRWDTLIGESDLDRKELLFHPHLRDEKPGDKHIQKPVKEGLHSHAVRKMKIVDDQDDVIAPVRYGFRTLDRQWIIPDARLINHSQRQVFLTGLERASPSSGASVSFTAHIPDLDHYNGRGGRVYPLWRDGALDPNIKPSLLTALAKALGAGLSAEDVFAYIAAVLAHPAFTRRFAPDLIRPGLRVPISADRALFNEAVELGREVIWLHCYGDRFIDPAARRPKAAPRMPKGSGPTIPAEGAIPGAPEPLPDTMTYDPAKQRLHVGEGFIDNVSPAMWDYEVSGKQVVWQWFSYRRRDRTRPIIGDRRPPSPLDRIQPDSWLPEYTTDLLDLLHVIGRLVALEPRQADLLERICNGALLAAEQLAAAPAPSDANAEENEAAPG